MTLTDTFIDGLLGKSKAIPDRVLEQAKKCLLDYLGVAVGGARFVNEYHPDFFSSLVKDSGKCTVFGTVFRTNPVYAAFLNGFSAHVLELDDGHRRGMIHLGASIISAVLAIAEQEDLAFDDILRGIVMGYETAVRCACSLQPGHKVRGYHVSGTCGTIGSALGIAFACHYSGKQIKSTLSCAVTSASGILEIQENASELKPYNLGRAAMDGCMAAQTGRLGLPAPDDILGGRRGFLSVLTDTPVLSNLSDFSDAHYCIEGIYQKLYAACRHCHPAIEAAIAIRNSEHVKHEQIESVEVHTYKLAVGGHDHARIQGISSAKLSTPFSVALGIVRGEAGHDDFNDSSLIDSAILMLMQKVHVSEDKSLSDRSPAVRGARVIIRLKGGEVFENTVLYPKGEPENPISYDEIKQKAYSLIQDNVSSYAYCLLGGL